MTVGAKDARLRRDIFKRSIAPIVVKNVFDPGSPRGPHITEYPSRSTMAVSRESAVARSKST